MNAGISCERRAVRCYWVSCVRAGLSKSAQPGSSSHQPPRAALSIYFQIFSRLNSPASGSADSARARVLTSLVVSCKWPAASQVSDCHCGVLQFSEAFWILAWWSPPLSRSMDQQISATALGLAVHFAEIWAHSLSLRSAFPSDCCAESIQHIHSETPAAGPFAACLRPCVFSMERHGQQLSSRTHKEISGANRSLRSVT